MLDGDDYFVNKSFIKEAMEQIISNPRIVVVIGGAKVLKQHGGYIDKLPLKGISTRMKIVSGKNVFFSWHKNISFYHGAVLYKRELALPLNFYSQGFISDDMASILKLIIHGDVLFLNTIVYVWRKNEQSLTFTADLKKRIENFGYIKEVYDYVVNLHLYDIKALQKWKKQMMQSYSQTIAYELIESNQWREVPHLLAYLLKNYPYGITSVFNYFLYLLVYRIKPLYSTFSFFKNKYRKENRKSCSYTQKSRRQ